MIHPPPTAIGPSSRCLACATDRPIDVFDPGPPPIVQCRSCRFLWTVPDHTPSDQEEFFSREYIDSEARADHDFGDMRRASLTREARLLREARPQGGRLLDVGCASGEFLRHFAGFGSWRVEGLEPSSFAVRRARESGLTVHEGTLTSVDLPPGSYDVVSALDVIPFWRDPESDIAAIRRLLVPGGLLAIEIPCLRFRLLKNTGLVSRIVYGQGVRLNQRLHLYFYSRKTLGTVLSRHGFREIAAHPEQSPLYGGLALRALNHAFYAATASLYRLSGGRIPLVPKELLVYRFTP